MIDFSTIKNLTFDGVELKELYINNTKIWENSYTNLVPTSIDLDGSIFNGTGYQDGHRLSSSGAIKVQNNTCVCGLIPAKNGDIIRSYGCDWNTSREYGDYYTYIGFYDANKNWLGSWNNYNTNNNYPNIVNCEIIEHGNGIITYKPNVAVPYFYVRLALWGEGKDLIVTVNEIINI